MNINKDLLKNIEKCKELQKYKFFVDEQLKALIPRVNTIISEKLRLEAENNNLKKENVKSIIPPIIEMTEPYKKLQEENNELQEENNELQEENKALNTLIIELPKQHDFEINRKEKEIIKLKNQISEKENIISKLQNEIELNKQLKSDKTTLETENNKKDIKILETSNNLKDLNTQLDVLKLQYDQKSKEFDTLKSQLVTISANKDQEMDALKLEKDKAIAEITKQKDAEIKGINDENEELFETVENKNLELEAEVKRLKDAELKRIEARSGPPPQGPPQQGPPQQGPSQQGFIPSKDFPPIISVLCQKCIIKSDEFHILNGNYTWNTNPYSFAYEKNGSSITFKHNRINNRWEIKQHGSVVAVSDISNIDITKNNKWTISNTNLKKNINLPEDQGNTLNLIISKKTAGGKRRTNKRRKTFKKKRRTCKK